MLWSLWLLKVVSYSLNWGRICAWASPPPSFSKCIIVPNHPTVWTDCFVKFIYDRCSWVQTIRGLSEQTGQCKGSRGSMLLASVKLYTLQIVTELFTVGQMCLFSCKRERLEQDKQCPCNLVNCWLPSLQNV